jgi:hypothetical protein
MRAGSLRRGVTAVLVGSLAVAGCSGNGGDDARRPTATVATEPATTTTTGVPVDQVPAVIDVAYVQRVIDALDRVEGDAVRELVRARVPNREFYERIRAIYLDPQFQRVQESYGLSAAANLSTLVENPGDPATRIERLITASSECIFATDIRDFGPILKVQPDEATKRAYIALGRKDPALDPSALNPTAWMIGFDGVTETGEEPRNPCVA